MPVCSKEPIAERIVSFDSPPTSEQSQPMQLNSHNCVDLVQLSLDSVHLGREVCCLLLLPEGLEASFVLGQSAADCASLLKGQRRNTRGGSTFLGRRSRGMYLAFLKWVLRASRRFWVSTVLTVAIDLRTTLLQTGSDTCSGKGTCDR